MNQFDRFGWTSVVLASVLAFAPAWGDDESAKSADEGAKPPKKAKGAKKEKAEGPNRLFDRFDKDGDGKIALEDLPEALKTRLGKMDKDGDGQISKEEMAPPKPGPGNRPEGGPDVGKLFDRFDKNKDGVLQADEVPERMQKNLARFDRNGDGTIEKSELAEVGGKGKKPGKPEGPLGAGMLERLKMFDTDGDGKIKIEDLPEVARKIVGPADADGDGMITVDEITKFQAKGPPSSGGRPDLFSAETLFKNFDGDGDGKLSKAELKVLTGKLPIERLDVNGDGELTKEEVDERLTMVRKMMEARRGKEGKPKADPRGRQLFDEQDANADGRVTKEEAKGVLAERFDTLDANGDGKLDSQEVENGIGPKPAKKKDPAKAKGEQI